MMDIGLHVTMEEMPHITAFIVQKYKKKSVFVHSFYLIKEKPRFFEDIFHLFLSYLRKK